MLDKKYEEIIVDILNKYGKEAQVLQTVEEMSELTKELIKNINRGKENRTDIILEIADVTIMLAQLDYIYDIKYEELQGAVEYKLLRQKERIENENN